MPVFTKETILALRQTCRGITGLAKYLINYCGFKYVVLGKIQSDTIEGRFGRIRQLSGASYYISLRQLLENDRKLQTLSLLKYSRISISHVDQVAKSIKNVENEVIAKVESLYVDLQFNILPTNNDVVVIFYVTGYCCKSLVSINKCAECKDAIIAGISEIPPGNIIRFKYRFMGLIVYERKYTCSNTDSNNHFIRLTQK